MTISNICVGVVVFLGIMFMSFMLGWLIAFICDDEDMTMFWAWLTTSVCLAVCMVVIFIQNNFI